MKEFFFDFKLEIVNLTLLHMIDPIGPWALSSSRRSGDRTIHRFGKCRPNNPNTPQFVELIMALSGRVEAISLSITPVYKRFMSELLKHREPFSVRCRLFTSLNHKAPTYTLRSAGLRLALQQIGRYFLILSYSAAPPIHML